MKNLQNLWKQRFHSVLEGLYSPIGQTLCLEQVVAEVPPKLEMGDLAFPMFSYAKALRQAPPLLAKQVAAALASFSAEAEIFPLGPYVNLRYSRSGITASVVERVLSEGEQWGRTPALKGDRVMVEFSSPNTNKPLHIGHLRNNILGESMSRILAANGAEVHKVILMNDRGIQICK